MRFLFGASEKNPLIKRRIGKHSVADQGKKAMPFDRKTWQREKKTHAHTHTRTTHRRGARLLCDVYLPAFFPLIVCFSSSITFSLAKFF